MKEVKLKHYTGPYKHVPFSKFIQSPVGLVPEAGSKDSSEVCLIFHLSYPRKPKFGKRLSVNANTPYDRCKVKYCSFNQAVQMCLNAGISCKMGKSDMTLAFRNLGILRSDWPLLILKATNPEDGLTYFFIDKCLPFGAAISCSHFQYFSDAVAHIVKAKSGRDLINYLDDYFFAALLMHLCNAQIELFLQICETINFPVSIEKTF